MKTVGAVNKEPIKPIVEPIEDELVGTDKIMQSVIDDKDKIKDDNPDMVTVEVMLTKKQYERYIAKGGDVWLRKAIYRNDKRWTKG